MSEYATEITDEIEKEWIAALRSGEYKQCTGTLEQFVPGHAPSYCCLGVLGVVLQEKGLADALVNQGDVPYDLAIDRYGYNHCLVDWNDGDKADFATIANRIELGLANVRHPEGKL